MSTPARAFELRDVRKVFGSTVAVDRVSLSGTAGQIIGLVGENGAGKSTLVKILSGVIPAGAFDGEVVVGGQVRRFRHVRDAEEAGIVAIPQELAIVPELSVAENLFLNREPRRFGLVDYARMSSSAERLLAEFELSVDPFTAAGQLSIARQQVLEIARALSRRAQVLILDEPTASLTQQETTHLFARLAELKRQGICALYISHRLDEVTAIADHIVVIRDGRIVLEGEAGQLDGQRIVSAMVGRELLGGATRRDGAADQPPLLSVEHLTVEKQEQPDRPLVSDVSFDVAPGETLGIFGAMGSGRSELLMSLFGSPPGRLTGTIRVRGEQVRIRDPGEALRLGLALVTEDRKGLGLQPALTVRENLSLAILDRVSRRGFVRVDEEHRVAEQQVERLRVATATVEQPVATLSGGNQQKVLIGRALLSQPSILLLDEPTRGVDVGAKFDIYAILRELTSEGLAVVVVSSEAPEILEIADRVVVMRDGRVVSERRTAETTEGRLVADATGLAEPRERNGADGA